MAMPSPSRPRLRRRRRRLTRTGTEPPGDSFCNEGRLGVELDVREPEHAVICFVQGRVPLAVSVEGLRAAVGGVGVDLDDELVLGPVEVDLEALYQGVEEGLRELVVTDQLEELLFVARTGFGGRGVKSFNYGGEELAALLASVALDGCSECSFV